MPTYHAFVKRGIHTELARKGHLPSGPHELVSAAGEDNVYLFSAAGMNSELYRQLEKDPDYVKMTVSGN